MPATDIVGSFGRPAILKDGSHRARMSALLFVASVPSASLLVAMLVASCCP